MDGHGRIFLLLQVFFCFAIITSTGETKQNCSQVQCPGPLLYYKEVGCTPVYKNERDCCAYNYNCDHLDARSPNNCYIQNNSYNIGESLRDEDKSSCDINCECTKDRNSAYFSCYYLDFTFPPVYDGCYMKRDVHYCGPGPVICPKNQSEVPQCVVDGFTYKGGEFFYPNNEQGKTCMCEEGYEGKNIEPFCIKRRTWCGLESLHSKYIGSKCVPTYFNHDNPATNCHPGWRCQNERDIVIPYPNRAASSEQDSSVQKDMTCKFGNLTMKIGDELNKNTDYSSFCMRCVCEVPPVPTCRRLNDNECMPVFV